MSVYFVDANSVTWFSFMLLFLFYIRCFWRQKEQQICCGIVILRDRPADVTDSVDNSKLQVDNVSWRV